MEAILPSFERASGHKVMTLYGTAPSLKTRIEGGESFDVAVLDPVQTDDLIKQGKALGPERADLARSAVGLVIPANAPKPDISSDEKLKTFLLGVKSISISDPAFGGFGSVYFNKMASALGIADLLKAKTIYTRPGEGPTPVTKGESELSVSLSSEVPVGVQFLPLNADSPGSYMAFAGAIAANAKDVEAARALLAFIQGPVGKETFKVQGMTIP
jgi:molybdate transport system substrate-binding protein